MTKQVRYVSAAPIIALRNEYERRYDDSRHDIRFDSTANSRVGIEVRLDLPDWAGDEVTRDMQRVLDRAIRQAIYEIGAVAANAFAERQASE